MCVRVCVYVQYMHYVCVYTVCVHLYTESVFCAPVFVFVSHLPVELSDGPQCLVLEL